MVEKKRKSKRVPVKQREKIKKFNTARQKEKRRQGRKTERVVARVPNAVKRTETELRTLEMIRKNAELRQTAFEERGRVEVQSEEGAEDFSRKTYMRDVVKLISACDVLLEILDARDPVNSRSIAVEKMALEAGKKVVLVLNKIDLVPREVWEGWVAYFKKFLPCIPFKASTQTQKSNLGESEKSEKGRGAYGIKDVMSLLKNYIRGMGEGGSVTVGVFGYPNAGKSSFINSMKRARACEVGATPGVTRHLQNVVIDKSIRIVDSPGVVFKSGDALNNALRACTAIGSAEARTIAAFLFERISREDLMLVYELPGFSDVEQFLLLLAIKWGKLCKGGIPDTDTVARIVVRDLQRGKIKFYTKPPSPQDSGAGGYADHNREFLAALAGEMSLDSERERDFTLLENIPEAKLTIKIPGRKAAAKAEKAEAEVVNMAEETTPSFIPMPE